MYRSLLITLVALLAAAAPAVAAPPGPWDASTSPRSRSGAAAARGQLHRRGRQRPAGGTRRARDTTDRRGRAAGARLRPGGRRHRHGQARGTGRSASRSRSPRPSSTSPRTPRPAARVVATERSWSTSPGTTDYTTPIALQRGGFRFLTLFLDSGGPVDVSGVSVHYTAAPTMADPSAYANYFHSSDELLNRIWYAGAYTVQTNTIDPTQGRIWPAPDALWSNTGVVGAGDTILTDGAKRDRTVWPGDLGIALPAAYASTGDTVSTRNALTTMYDKQSATARCPYSGPPLSKSGSDTYHLWTLSATGDLLRLHRRQGLARHGLDPLQARHRLHPGQDGPARPALHDHDAGLVGPHQPGRAPGGERPALAHAQDRLRARRGRGRCGAVGRLREPRRRPEDRDRRADVGRRRGPVPDVSGLRRAPAGRQLAGALVRPRRPIPPARPA